MTFRGPLSIVALGLIVAVSSQADEKPAAKIKEVVYRKTPQAELKLHVHFPPEWKTGDARPAIVFFFGGGWTGGKVEQFERQAAYLASRGMVAARADYRVKSRHGVMPDECVRDAQAAIRYVRQHAAELGVDPNRIVASGGSAGGHLAATCGISPALATDDANADVSCAANAFVLFNPALNIFSLGRLDDELAKQITPTFFVGKNTPPVIMFFGDRDRLIEHGREYLDAATKAGATAQLVVTEGQSHGFFNRSPYTEQTLLKTDEFLVSLGYLSGKPTIEVPAP